MNRLLIIFFLCLCCEFLSAQTLTKEALNNFALYTQKAEFSSLEKARKNIDDAYKTRKDSLSYKVNLIRSLVYSSLAFADSTRKLQYKKDPIDEAMFSLEKLKNSKANYENEPQLRYIKKQLAAAWLKKADKASKNQEYELAYSSYLWVDSLSTDNFVVKHNLALLSDRLGYTEKAIGYYSFLVSDQKRSLPDYYLALSNLYEQSRNPNKALDVISQGRRAFPANKDLLFKEINTYSDNGDYAIVVNLVDEALKFDPYNVNLLYIAGFAFQITGKHNRAEQYYKEIISLEYSNYEANYALGLLYLDLYLKRPENNKDLLSLSRRYLVLASEIDPNSTRALKALAILYKQTNNFVELQRVNNKLSQIF